MNYDKNDWKSDFAWYKLVNVKGLGPNSLLIIYRALVKESLSVEDVFNLGKEEFYFIFKEFGKGHYSKAKYENFHILDEETLFKTFEQLRRKSISLIPLQNEMYPDILKKRLKVNSPPILYAKGNFQLFKSSSISIVGSRNADENILRLTKELAFFLSGQGFNIVSGYAKGVDTNAHLGALESGGTTSVVLAQGMNYLSVKRDFREFAWENNTLFISQFLPYVKWRGSNAMKRNKIVTALSQAVVVISSGPERDEKGRMSGTFDAGKSALEMKIPVFVLTPKLFFKPPIGNQDLINFGAIEFSEKEDILRELSKIKKDDNGITQFENKLHPKQLRIDK